MGYVLQNRWKMVGKYLLYYGIRKKPYLNKNKIKLSNKEVEFFKNFLNGKQIENKTFNKFFNQKIIVNENEFIKTPKNLEEAIFCKTCIANNFIIPGIEFDESGRCPICADTEKDIISVLPIKNNFEKLKNKSSRFDVALFYTGGKDSTYLLYYLSKILKLKVLVLTWEIPFMSANARQSIDNAKKIFNEAEFVSRQIAEADLKRMYKKLLKLQNNTCACPSLAYVIFYPLLCQEKIPYLILGNEPAQMKALYYNRIAPKIAYRFQNYGFLHFFMNLGRLFLLKKPLKTGQREMLLLVKQLAYGDHVLKKISGYKNQLISNVCSAIDCIPNLKKTLKRAIKLSDRNSSMPALVHIDMNSISEIGVYDYRKIEEILIRECGFVAPDDKNKVLHASCGVEAAKDYSQFKSFYYMESQMIPFSALELIISSGQKCINIDAAIEEMKHNFVLRQPWEHEKMERYVNE